MNEATFLARIEAARKIIDSLPADRQAALLELLDETEQRHVELKSNFGRIHDVLEDWKVSIKYLLFDLEATRRELEELRQQQRGGQNDRPE